MIGVMGRKRSDRAAEGASASSDKHLNRSYSVRPPAPMRDEIEALAKLERRKISQMILILLEDALAARKPQDGNQAKR